MSGPADDDPTMANHRRPGKVSRAFGAFESVKHWDRRLHVTLGCIVLAFLGLLGVRWLALSVIHAQGDAAERVAIVLDDDEQNNEAQVDGSAQRLAGLLQALEEPFDRWPNCTPTNHAAGIIGVGIGKDGKATNKLDPVRSWTVALGVIDLGPGVDITKVAVGTDDMMRPIVAPDITEATPGRLCLPPPPSPVPAGPATTSTTKAAGS